MRKPITVKILVTVNDMAHFDACTLCFNSLRTGWPTADIHVYVNGNQHYWEVVKKLQAPTYNINVHGLGFFWHHADWIRMHTT